MSPGGFRFIVPRPGERVDRLVADATGRGRRAVRQWLEAGCVRVDGRIARASDSPPSGSQILVEDLSAPQDPGPSWTLRIVAHNEHRIVVAKPAGLHCERGKSAGSVAELLEQAYGDLSQVGARAAEAGLVHRIDRDTSGVVIAAREAGEYRRLREAFRSGATLKHYLALAAGRLGGARQIDLALARRGDRMIVAGRHDDALPARTGLELLDGGDDWSLVLASMSTGVTHQVRVHMAAAGHPLLGDSLYGGPSLPGSQRSGHLLHALRVQVAGDVDVTVGPPEDFLKAYASLSRRER